MNSGSSSAPTMTSMHAALRRRPEQRRAAVRGFLIQLEIGIHVGVNEPASDRTRRRSPSPPAPDRPARSGRAPCQSVAIMQAVRWPPAECPYTVMRLPKRFHRNSTAARISLDDLRDRDLRRQIVARDRDSDAVAGQPAREMAVLLRAHGAPIAAMNEQGDRGIGVLRLEQIDILPLGRPEPDIEFGAALLDHHLTIGRGVALPLRHDIREIGHRRTNSAALQRSPFDLRSICRRRSTLSAA